MLDFIIKLIRKIYTASKSMFGASGPSSDQYMQLNAYVQACISNKNSQTALDKSFTTLMNYAGSNFGLMLLQALFRFLRICILG